MKGGIIVHEGYYKLLINHYMHIHVRCGVPTCTCIYMYMRMHACMYMYERNAFISHTVSISIPASMEYKCCFAENYMYVFPVHIMELSEFCVWKHWNKIPLIVFS